MATFEAYSSHYSSYFYTQIVSYHFNAQVGNFVVFSTCGDGDYHNTTISDEDGTAAFVTQCSWSSPSSTFLYSGQASLLTLRIDGYYFSNKWSTQCFF